VDDAIRSIQLFCDKIAEAYMAGAKKWEANRRAQSDKQAEEAVKAKPVKTQKAPAAGGPEVVKVNRGRKLVAAGTALEIEIAAEVEKSSTTKEGVTNEKDSAQESKDSKGSEDPKKA